MVVLSRVGWLPDKENLGRFYGRNYILNWVLHNNS